MSRATYIIHILTILSAALTAAFTAKAEGRLYEHVPAVEGMEVQQGFTTYDIARTNDGFIWFATDHGLIRYDGEHAVRVDLYGHENEDQSVKAVTPHAGGGLIAAGKTGIFRIQTSGHSHKITDLLGGQPFPATCAVWIPEKLSLIGGDEGIMIFKKDGKPERVTPGRGVLDNSNKVVDMARGKDGIYVLTKGDIFRLNPDNLTTTRIGESGVAATLGGSVLAATDRNLYIGTSGNGIWRLDLQTGKVGEAFGFPKGNVVTSMRMNHDGTVLYVGTDGGGVTKIDLNTEKIISNTRHIATDPISPSSNQVYSLYTDKGDHLWVGYYENGVDYTPSWNGPFELIDDPAVFNTRGVPVRALSICDGRITIGTRNGITVFERNCSTAWSISAPALRSEMVLSLLDLNGKTYIGTYGGGLQILNPVTRQVSDIPITGPNSVFTSGNIFSLASDKEGTLWMGTNQGLLKKLPSGEVKSFTSSNSGLPDGNVYGIFFDSEGKGWICTESGLCVYDPDQEKLRTDLFPSSFPRNTRFRTVYEDSRHRLYFVPEQGMVISTKLDLSDIQTLDLPLSENVDAKGVVEDKSGNIWITTNRGIYRFDSEGKTVRFGLASGLPSPVFLQGQPVSDAEGHIWFGNSAGLLRLTESEIDSSIEARRAPVPTILKVNGVATDLVPQPSGKDGSYLIELDKASNTIKIDFSTFTYALEEPEAYVYSLDGGEWHHFSKELSLTFYELSPGKHELKVRSANDTEGEGGITVVKIHVPYPMLWYVLIGLLIALIVVPVLVWVRIARRRQREDLRKESETTAAAAAAAAAAVPAPPEQEPEQRHKYASNTLSRNEAREIARKVEEVMQKEKPYLNADLKVADLAALVGVSGHKLSQFFSQHKGQTFYDYVNKFRVEEFKHLVKEDKNRVLTLSAMAEKAGFSSRASFFRHFKNIEGISPGEYLKNRQEGD